MALQKLCLTAIVENFERFYTAYSTSEDENLKRMFEFLQRVYSYEIATEIFQECEIEEKYTDLLINKYLKILHTDWFDKCSWRSVVAKMAEVGPNIKKMFIDSCSVDRPWYEIFCHLPNIEVMHFHHNYVNEILSSIANFCPNIIEIDLRSSVTFYGEGLRHLCERKNGKPSCPKLKKLILKSCVVTEEIAKCLIKDLPSLEVFDYYDFPFVLYSMHKQDIPVLDKIQPYNFNKLHFSSAFYSDLTEVLKVCLTLCPFVTSLSCPILKPQHLDLLSGLSHLEFLRLEYNQDDDYLDINNLLESKGSKLTSLIVQKCSLSVLTLAKSCPLLKLLSMNTVSFEQHDNTIPLFHNLDEFIVETTELSNNANNLKSVCLIWSSSPKLESIVLNRCNLTSSDVKTEIQKSWEFCLVKKMDFNNCYIDKQFALDTLLSCHSLKIFVVDGCEFDDGEKEEIYKCADILPNNPEVYFSDWGFSDYDDFLDDYYDNDLDDDEEYEDEYNDYLDAYDDDDDDDGGEVYGYYF